MDQEKFLKNFALILGDGAVEELNKIEQKRQKEKKLLEMFGSSLSKVADFEIAPEDFFEPPKEIKIIDKIVSKPLIVSSEQIKIEPIVVSSVPEEVVLEPVALESPAQIANTASEEISVEEVPLDYVAAISKMAPKKQQVEVESTSLLKEIEQMKKQMADFHRMLLQASSKAAMAGSSHGGGEVKLAKLDDIDYSSLKNAANGQVLVYNANLKKWQAQNANLSGGAVYLTQLQDVVTGTPANGDILTYVSDYGKYYVLPPQVSANTAFDSGEF